MLGLPPAFVLSQDQTLKLTWRSISTNAHITICDLRHNYFDLRGCVYGFRFATERRLRIPFVRLFTMSKNPEPGDKKTARNLAKLANRSETRRSPLGLGGRFLSVAPNRVNTFFQKNYPKNSREFPRGYQPNTAGEVIHIVILSR